MNAWRIKISESKQSILIDFQGSINAYTGIPLTVKNDAVCFASAGFNVILWINNAAEIPKIDNWIREESRLPKSYKFEFDCSRPKNWVLWLKQLFQIPIHFKQSTFFYCDLFPGVRINNSTLRIVRVHDPFSNSVSATKSFIESPARMKLRVAKFLRVTAFNRIRHESYLVFNSKFTKKRFCAIHGDGKGSIVIYPTIQFKSSPNSSFNIENQKAVGDFIFLPLVTDKCNKVIDFKFTFLSHYEPGNGLNFPTGDTDNHLKALLDGLRMPNTMNEIRTEKPKKGEKIFHCLMEDDGIVRKINIEHQKLLFSGTVSNDKLKEVFVLIEANIVPKYS